MPIVYPAQSYGRYRLGLGLTYKLIHERFGFELGEEFHRNLDCRVVTAMEIDRAVFEAYGGLGLGYKEPFPRVSIEPFGHRFVPAMYGCECGYAVDADPWSRPRTLSAEEIKNLEPWTPERFAASEPVRVVADQIDQLKQRYDRYRVPDREFNPHWRGMSAVQNLGSVINTAFSVQGEELFVDYAERPGLVHKLYDNITQLMLLGLECFSALDGWPLRDVFIGDCTVAMISPEDYARFNYPQDHRLMEFARAIGAGFMIHQDSDANRQLENYARFEHLSGFDLGQDTDFEKLASLKPEAEVNCLLFPAWIEAHSAADMAEELTRLMIIGRRFRRFSFTMLEMDTRLDGDPIHMFYETFQRCARDCSRRQENAES